MLGIKICFIYIGIFFDFKCLVSFNVLFILILVKLIDFFLIICFKLSKIKLVLFKIGFIVFIFINLDVFK